MFSLFKDLWKELLFMAVLLFLLLVSCQHQMNKMIENGGLKAAVKEVWEGKEKPANKDGE